jgi:hypothetical protein
MGKDIEPEEVNRISTTRVHLAGGCAIQDYGLEMQRRFGKKNVTFSNGCNNLAETIYALCRHMKVSPIKLSRANPVSALGALMQAKIHGTRAIIPPLI